VKVRFRCVECRFGGCGECARPHQNRNTGAFSYWCMKCGNRALEVARAYFRMVQMHLMGRIAFERKDQLTWAA
jgi:hypothetical protein